MSTCKIIYDTLHISFNNEELISVIILLLTWRWALVVTALFWNTAKTRIGNKIFLFRLLTQNRLGFLADIAKNEVLRALREFWQQIHYIEKEPDESGDTGWNTFRCSPIHLICSSFRNRTVRRWLLFMQNKGELINSYQVDGLIISAPALPLIR